MSNQSSREHDELSFQNHSTLSSTDKLLIKKNEKTKIIIIFVFPPHNRRGGGGVTIFIRSGIPMRDDRMKSLFFLGARETHTG